MKKIYNHDIKKLIEGLSDILALPLQDRLLIGHNEYNAKSLKVIQQK